MSETKDHTDDEVPVPPAVDDDDPQIEILPTLPAPVEPPVEPPAAPPVVTPMAAGAAPVQAAVSEPTTPDPSAELRAAIASKRRSKRALSDGELEAEVEASTRPARRWPLILALISTAVAAIATMVVIGRVHAARYGLRCHAKEIVAERGRSFPPWGYQRLTGAAWKPIAIPPDAECTEHTTEDVVQLEGWFLEALIEQATRKLSGAIPGDLDRAEAELSQALLLSRSPERRDQRKDLERLRGDVTYWRAAAKIKAAIATLEDAARGFDDATAQRPRHASDPSRWAAFVRASAAALSAGPDGQGVPTPTGPAGPATSTRPMAPPGIALPIDAPPFPIDAGQPEADPDAARSDLPSGGVLM